jgi:hypothetical protein
MKYMTMTLMSLLSSFSFWCKEDDDDTMCHHCPLLVSFCRSIGRKTMNNICYSFLFFLL